MIGLLLSAPTELMHWTAIVLIHCVRPAIAFTIFPGTSDPMLTTSIRAMLAGVFGVFAATGAYQAGWQLPQAPVAVALLVFREAAIGFTIGFAAGKVFWVAQGVGAYIDNMAGYNNVQLTNPSSPEQSTPVSDMMMQLAVAVFWSLGGMLLVAGALFETWVWWPMAGKTPTWPEWPVDIAAAQFTALMRTIASVATPLLFLIAVIDIALGLISRAAKNVDTNALAKPLKSGAAVLSLVLFSSVFAQDIKSYLAMDELLQWVRAWGGR